MLDANNQKQGGSTAKKAGGKGKQGEKSRSALASQKGEEAKSSVHDLRATASRGRVMAMSSFNGYLAQYGMTPENIREVEQKIKHMFKTAKIKETDSPNMIELLKKVEINLHELVERRQIHAFFDLKTLAKKEKEVHDNRKEISKRQKKDLKSEEELRSKEALKELMEQRRNLVIHKSIRDSKRSTKPTLRPKNVETVKTPREIEELRTYLGFAPNEWQA